MEAMRQMKEEEVYQGIRVRYNWRLHFKTKGFGRQALEEGLIRTAGCSTDPADVFFAKSTSDLAENNQGTGVGLVLNSPIRKSDHTEPAPVVLARLLSYPEVSCVLVRQDSYRILRSNAEVPLPHKLDGISEDENQCYSKRRRGWRRVRLLK